MTSENDGSGRAASPEMVKKKRREAIMKREVSLEEDIVVAL